MTLILCFGNPLRGDEAVGWRVAERLPGAEVGARVVACHALVPEFAPAIAAAEVVIFVDACAGGTPGEVGTPSVSMPEPAFTSSESEWPW